MARLSALTTFGSVRNGCGCAAVERSAPSAGSGSVWLTWMRSTSVPKAEITSPRPAASICARISGSTWTFQA